MKKLILVCIFFIVIGWIAPSLSQEKISFNLVEFENTSILEFTNNEDVPIYSIRLWVEDLFSFTSFKTENGWSATKPNSGTLIINSSEPLSTGQSVKIGVKTNQPDTIINWRLNGQNETLVLVGHTLQSDADNTKSKIGILNNSSFKIIPDIITKDSTIRVFGNNFGAKQNLGLYLNSTKIDSFTTDSKGDFVFTSKIPENIDSGINTFLIKDHTGRSISIPTIIRDHVLSKNIEKSLLSLTPLNPSIIAGEEVIFSGNATPYSKIILSVQQPNSITVSKSTTTNSKGEWSLVFKTDKNITTGNYIARISDSKTTIPVIFSVTKPTPLELLSEKIYSESVPISFDIFGSGESKIKLSLLDSKSEQISSFTINSTATQNKLELEPYYLPNGFYTLFAFQNFYSDSTSFGVKTYPQVELSSKLDKVNYRNYETATLSILGQPYDRLELLIVDSAQRTIFEDKITLDSDGKSTYHISLDAFVQGSYSMILSKGNIKVNESFTVGFNFGSTIFDVILSKDRYFPNDTVQFFGQTTPHTALDIFLIDPTGTIIRKIESFSKDNGEFYHTEMKLPSNAIDGRWILRVESGINSANFGFVVESPYTLFNVDISEVTLSPAGFLVVIEGQYAIPNSLVDISIENTDSDQIWNQPVRSNSDGKFNLLWIVPKQYTGEFIVVADDSVNTSEVKFNI